MNTPVMFYRPSQIFDFSHIFEGLLKHQCYDTKFIMNL
jgi:hypothetical protein